MANLVVTILLISAAASATPAAAYTNYTVGGPAGWFFNATTNTSSTDFSKWAANQTFNLGDFLVFKTNSNQTVVQTYNETTYRSCSTDDSLDNDTFQYSGGNNQFGEALTIAVPLTIEGLNYYFSDADDGVQCEQGMRFQIAVKHGVGLPPSLSQPPPPPYAEPPPEGEAQTPPSTVPGGAQTKNHGGLSRGANVREVVCILLLCFGILSFY